MTNQMVLSLFVKYLWMISIFSNVFDKDKSQRDLKNDLSIVSGWAYYWKIKFNRDPNKQANEVYFSWKPNTDDYLPIKLNYSPVQLCESQKHFGFILDKHPNFYELIEKKI